MNTILVSEKVKYLLNSENYECLLFVGSSKSGKSIYINKLFKDLLATAVVWISQALNSLMFPEIVGCWISVRNLQVQERVVQERWSGLNRQALTFLFSPTLWPIISRLNRSTNKNIWCYFFRHGSRLNYSK